MPSLPSIDQIDGDVDLAVILTAADKTVAAVEACVTKGVPSAIVIASGFAELDSRGAAIQAQVKKALKDGNTRVLGPNSVGIVSARSRLVASIATGMDQDRFELNDGGIAMVTQSGAVGAFIVNSAQSRGIPVATMISTGNEMDVGFSDMVAGLLEDPEVQAVMGYIEGIRDPRAFVEVLERAAELGKPMAFLKAGKSNLGSAATASHTGALAGESGVYSGIFAQFGAAEVSSVEGLLDWATLVTAASRLGQTRISMVTSSGGAGILCADYCDREQLPLADWSGHWKTRLAELLPPFLAPRNPIDMGAAAGHADELAPTLALMNEHEDTDIVLIVIGNLEKDEDALVPVIMEAAADSHKPLVVCWIAGSGRPLTELNRNGVPAYSEPQRALKALRRLAQGARRQRDRAAGAETRRFAAATTGASATNLGSRLAGIAVSGRLALDEFESENLLAEYGFTIPRHVLATTAEEAAMGADRLGFPVVLKAVSPSIQHKTDQQCVFVGLQDADEVRARAESLLARTGTSLPADTRLLVQEMVPGGVELILGMKHDPTFGPVIVFGLGGVMTELFDDVQIRLPDCSREEISTALGELVGAKHLEPFRGQPAIDRDLVAEAVEHLSRIARDLGDRVSAIDVNPLIANRSEGTLTAVDASVFLSPPLETEGAQ
jgi:acyl-CoA synthetase (NDP forming)